MIGTAELGDPFCARLAQYLQVVVAAVDYRLAPEHPYPTPLEDAHAALRWLAEQPDVVLRCRERSFGLVSMPSGMR